MPEAQLTTTRSAGTIWVLLTSSLPNPSLPPMTNERVADEPVMALPAAESSSTQAPRFFSRRLFVVLYPPTDFAEPSTPRFRESCVHVRRYVVSRCFVDDVTVGKSILASP